MIKICVSVTSHALDPPLHVTNWHTFSAPLERDVLYGRPLRGPVIELPGGWEGSTPSSLFNPPAYSQKLPWGQARPVARISTMGAQSVTGGASCSCERPGGQTPPLPPRGGGGGWRGGGGGERGWGGGGGGGAGPPRRDRQRILEHLRSNLACFGNIF